MPSITELLERDCVVLIESTIPGDMTIAQWRRDQTQYRVETRRGRRRRRVRDWGR
jgi:hypothetical protein